MAHKEWQLNGWHHECADVAVVDIGGFPHAWCPSCRCLANFQAVSHRYLAAGDAGILGRRKPVPPPPKEKEEEAV